MSGTVQCMSPSGARVVAAPTTRTQSVSRVMAVFRFPALAGQCDVTRHGPGTGAVGADGASRHAQRPGGLRQAQAMSGAPLGEDAGVLVGGVLCLCIQPERVGADLDIELRPFDAPALAFDQGRGGKGSRITQSSQSGGFVEQGPEIERVDAALDECQPHPEIGQHLDAREAGALHACH